MNYVQEIKEALAGYANPARAEHSYRYFKAFPGGYGEGDRFLGVAVPRQRSIARKYWRKIDLVDVEKLLQDPLHECRLTAVFILVLRFSRASTEKEREEIIALYLRNLPSINNWDLVDASAPSLLGPYLLERDKTLLYRLADSGELWKQRIAVMTTLHFIRQGRLEETLNLARKFLTHPHDLIHKAVGWMLRELGKRDYTAAYNFLREHYRIMPRTMLRYAIEQYDPDTRQKFLKGLI